MRRLRSKQTGLSYVSQGADDAPLVLCLHGFPDIPRTWEPLTEVLTAAGFRIVSPWLPGYAPSSLDGAFEVPGVVTRRIVGLVDELSPDSPVRIVGHDWGAVLTCCALSQHPDRFAAAAVLAIPHPLVFETTMGRHPVQFLRSSYMALFQIPVVSEALVRRKDFRLVERLWEKWSPGFDPGPEYFDELKQCLRASLPAPLFYYHALRSPRALREFRELLAGEPIPVPTIYLHGERDGCVGIELTEGQERYFGALFETVRLADAGHFLHLERPDEVNRIIESWFQTHR